MVCGFGRVVEEQGVIRSLHSDRESSQTALVPSPNIALRNIMSAAENALPDAGQINLHVFGPDVNEHDLKTEGPRPNHHFEIVFSGERSLDREALSPLQVLICKTKDFAASSDR